MGKIPDVHMQICGCVLLCRQMVLLIIYLVFGENNDCNLVSNTIVDN